MPAKTPARRTCGRHLYLHAAAGAFVTPLQVSHLKQLPGVLLAFVVLLGLQVTAAAAGNTDPPFISPTTDNPHRATMALAFGRNPIERGRSMTVEESEVVAGVNIGNSEATDSALFLDSTKTLVG